MNCPSCGRFMLLVNALESVLPGGEKPELDIHVSAYWWQCTNYGICPEIYYPAPEYDWLYWWAGIDEAELTEAFAEDPALEAEVNEMKRKYLERADRG